MQKKNEMESDDSFIANLWRHKQARKHRSMRPNKQIYTKPVANCCYKANPDIVLEKNDIIMF